MSDYRPDIPPPLFRSTDPGTSRRAAQRAAAAGIIRGHEFMILRILKLNGAMTAKQIAAASVGNLDQVAVSRRVAGMIAKRLVRYGAAQPDGCLLIELEPQP